MELTDEQKKMVAGWAAAGEGLSEIQKRIREDFGVSMTFMDVRFLVIDLGASIKDKPSSRSTEKIAAKPEAPSGAVGAAEDEPSPFDDADEGIGGGVSVDVDRVIKPGSIVSGTVTFSDGVTATWALDQMGRLALDPGRAGYKPSAEDIRAFQEELRSALERRGF